MRKKDAASLCPYRHGGREELGIVPELNKQLLQPVNISFILQKLRNVGEDGSSGIYFYIEVPRVLL